MVWYSDGVVGSGVVVGGGVVVGSGVVVCSAGEEENEKCDFAPQFHNRFTVLRVNHGMSRKS